MSDSNISHTDIKFTVALLAAVIAISIIMPMAGVGDVEERDVDSIPSLAVDSQVFDFAGEFPRQPDTLEQGEIQLGDRYSNNDRRTDIVDNDEQLNLFIDSDGSQITFSAFDPETTSDIETDTLQVDDLQQGNSYDLGASDGDVNGDVTITIVQLDYTEITNDDGEVTGEEIDTVIVRWEATTVELGGGGWLTGIPIIGAIADAGSNAIGAAILITRQMIWGILTFFTLVTNLFFASGQVVWYVFEIIAYVVTGYTAVLAGANSAASQAVLTIPGVLLSLMIFRNTFTVINMLWVG